MDQRKDDEILEVTQKIFWTSWIS